MSLLIIGKGWSGTYIEALALEKFDSVFCTTRDGRNSTIQFNFTDPNDLVPFKRLPQTDYLVITFPFESTDMTGAFLNLYSQTHNKKPKMILLGSSRPFVGTKDWATSDSPLDINSDPIRTLSEELVLKDGGCVLHLAGLWDDKRDPRGWVSRIAPSKEALSLKTSIHLIHGADVAGAVVYSFTKFFPGKRWIVTDLRVYDWWDLVLSWGSDAQKGWVKELIR
jgi:hypothetical protein